MIASPVFAELPDDPERLEVTFAWAGEGDAVAVLGGPASGPPGANLLERGEDGVFRRTYRVPRGVRTTYGFLVDPPDGAPLTLELWRSIRADPLNPRTYRFPGDDQDPARPSPVTVSLLEASEAPPQPFVAERPGVPRGACRLHRFPSTLLGNERRVYVYTPPGFEQGDDHPLLVLLDGWAYTAVVPTPTILDNLIAERVVPPLVAVLPDSLDQEMRTRELSCDDRFVSFLTDELLPWARPRLQATDDPSRTIVAGSSLGGLTSAFAALERPDVFGCVLSQSGSFWAARAGEEEPEWLTRRVAELPRRPIRFWLEVGALETMTPRLAGAPTLLEANRRFRQALVEKGYELDYSEFAGGHDYVCWQGTLADGLVALAGEGRLSSR